VTPALAALLCLTAAEPAAEPQRFLILTESDDARRAGPPIEETIRDSSRFRLGLRFLTPEESFVEGGLEAQSGLASCAANANCLAARLRNVPADLALLVVVRRVGREELIALRIVRTTTGELVHQAVSQTPAGSPLAPAIAAITARAFDALRYPQGGELIVTVRPENAELTAGDRVLGSGRTTLFAAGNYVVRARLDGYEEQTTNLSLAPGETKRADLVLAPRIASTDGSLTSSSWFWIGVGVVGAAAAGVAIGVAAGGSERCFCAASNAADCGSCP
jgi:hypothetical protein